MLTTTLVASLVATVAAASSSLVPLSASHPRYEALSLLLSEGLAHANERTSVVNAQRSSSVCEYRADVFSKRRRRGLSRLGRSSASRLKLATGGGSRGASRRGTVFALSADGKYLIKEESASAVERLCGVAEDYCAKAQGSSLLPRYSGAYKVTTSGGKTSYFVVMANVMRADAWTRCSTVYDLKGSTTGRKAKSPQSTQKDLDALEADLAVSRRVPRRLIRRLGDDTAFLESRGFLDYSLLVGVFDTPRIPVISRLFRRPMTWLSSVLFRRRERGVLALHTLQRKKLLIVGLIDVLQNWDLTKRLEYACRGALYGYSEISAVPPQFYRKRFLAFVESLFTKTKK